MSAKLNKEHIIDIDAVAFDPIGAQAIRKLEKKIQEELDYIKEILEGNNIPIDTISLHLDARGFIDKPIGFKIAKDKILELLVVRTFI